MADTTQWTRENLAWLAGLFDGEGCIRTPPSKPGRRCRPPNLKVQMTDVDLVRRAASIAGCGTLSSSQPRPHQRLRIYSWDVTKQLDVYALLIALWPWFGERRRAKTTSALTTWLSYPHFCRTAADIRRLRAQLAGGGAANGG